NRLLTPRSCPRCWSANWLERTSLLCSLGTVVMSYSEAIIATFGPLVCGAGRLRYRKHFGSSRRGACRGSLHKLGTRRTPSCAQCCVVSLEQDSQVTSSTSLRAYCKPLPAPRRIRLSVPNGNLLCRSCAYARAKRLHGPHSVLPRFRSPSA